MTFLKSKTAILKPFLNLAQRMPRASRELYRKIYDPRTCEVRVESRVTLADYSQVTPPKDLKRLKAYAKALAGKRLMFINATYAGGGVAIMRAPLIALLRAVGVDAHWYVLLPDKAAFRVTKRKFHNVLQDVAGKGVELTASDKLVYERWIKRNAKVLAEPISKADVIIIDDWQPSGLIPFIKDQLNPTAKIIFRDHIHTEGALMAKPGTPQHVTWRYIWDHNQVNQADVFAVHPNEEFVPPNVPAAKVAYLPAASDLLDDLNRSLSHQERRQGIAYINNQLRADKQLPLDLTRPYIVLIARFDPSKGMPEAMAAYALARSKMLSRGLTPQELPQLVIIGNGSVDDPDGVPMLAKIKQLRRRLYGDIKDDIKVARVPHYDTAINALLSGAALALQPSIKEGFESRVTDAILQGVPVIGSSRGGIPLQIVEGESGWVLDPYDTEAWSERIAEFILSPKLARQMREQTLRLGGSYNYQFTTVPNAINWLYLSYQLLTNPNFKANKSWVRGMVESAKLPS